MTWYYIAAIVLAFLGMEIIAWFVHKYIMHGFLWSIHRDHHTREHAPLEWNDIFATIFAVPSILLISFNIPEFNINFYLGIGILLYGIVYFFLHDILVHDRIPLGIMKKFDNSYFRKIRAAHDVHHHDGANYGFVFLFDWDEEGVGPGEHSHEH